MTLEICANSLQSAINAQEGGADRIELCASLWCGGITPNAACIQLAIKQLKIPVFVLIRPRSGSFVYTDTELQQMCHNISLCRDWGVKGIVSGALTAEGQIDLKATSKLIEASKGLDFTFHRAIDICKNPVKAIHELVELGADRVLTSGAASTAIEGIDLLEVLQQEAGKEIYIMAGSGLKANDVQKLAAIGIKEFHLSAKAKINCDVLANESKVQFGGAVLIPEFDYFESKATIVRQFKTQLLQLKE